MAPPAPPPQQPQPRRHWVGKNPGKNKRRGGGPERTPADRLQHAATKEIGRELKKIKAFLLQRLVKRCRRLRGGGDGKKTTAGRKREAGASSSEGEEESGDEAAAAAGNGAKEEEPPAVKACLEEIKGVKALTAESVAPVCLRRLGLAYTGSEHAALSEAAAGPGPLRQALEHPRMAALLQSLDARVTDLRRGGDGKAPKQQQQQQGKKRRRGPDDDDDGGEGEEDGSGGVGPLARVRRRATAEYEGSSVFLDSLSGFVPQRSLHRGQEGDAGDETGDGGMDVYGYREFGAGAQRKNRPGQRARKAKMEAIQAAMAGKARGGPSSNWRGERRGGIGGGGGGGGSGPGAGARGGSEGRRPHPSHQQHQHQQPRRPPPPAAAAPPPTLRAPVQPPPSQQSRAESKDAAALHPSWAAKQAQRAKLAGGAFQGKKITFASDDD